MSAMTGDDATRDESGAAMLERFGTTLRSPAVWEQPPDDLADRIVARVGALRAGDGHVGDHAGGGGVTRRARRGRALDGGVRPGCGPCWRRQLHSSSPSPPAPCSSTATTTAVSARSSRSHRSNWLPPTAAAMRRPRAASSTPAPATRSTSRSPACRRRPKGAYYEGWLHNAGLRRLGQRRDVPHAQR